MASSTTIPNTMMKPKRDIMLMVPPRRGMKMIPPAKATGIPRRIQRARVGRRKRPRTMRMRIAPCTRELVRVERRPRRAMESSSHTESVMPAGRREGPCARIL